MTLKKIAINQLGLAQIALVVIVVAVIGAGAITFFAVSNENSNDNQIGNQLQSTDPAMSDNEDLADNSAVDSQQLSDQVQDSNTNEELENSVQSTSQNPTSGISNSSNSAAGSSSSNNDAESSQTKSVLIDSFSFGYSISTINVSPGDIVTINLTNSGGKHDWVVDEIPGASTAIINGGQSDSITFTVPQSAAGNTYKFYCSVGNHRALGMEGNFIVASQ